MTENVRRIRLFVGSYALLFLLLAIRFTTPWLVVVCGIVALIGFADMARIVFVVSRRTSSDPVRIARVRDSGAEVSGYLATYLLPFLTVEDPGWRDLTAYAVFIGVLGLVYVRSEMTQINPTLYLFGRRVVHVVTEGGWNGHVVTRAAPVTPGMVLHVASLDPVVRVETGKPRTDA